MGPKGIGPQKLGAPKSPNKILGAIAGAIAKPLIGKAIGGLASGLISGKKE